MNSGGKRESAPIATAITANEETIASCVDSGINGQELNVKELDHDDSMHQVNENEARIAVKAAMATLAAPLPRQGKLLGTDLPLQMAGFERLGGGSLPARLGSNNVVDSISSSGNSTTKGGYEMALLLKDLVAARNTHSNRAESSGLSGSNAQRKAKVLSVSGQLAFSTNDTDAIQPQAYRITSNTEENIDIGCSLVAKPDAQLQQAKVRTLHDILVRGEQELLSEGTSSDLP